MRERNISLLLFIQRKFRGKKNVVYLPFINKKSLILLFVLNIYL